MIHVPLHFRNTDDITRFVHVTTQFPYDLDVVNGKRIVDAKSLLGVLAFGIQKDLSLTIHADKDSHLSKRLLESLQDFIPAQSA